MRPTERRIQSCARHPDSLTGHWHPGYGYSASVNHSEFHWIPWWSLISGLRRTEAPTAGRHRVGRTPDDWVRDRGPHDEPAFGPEPCLGPGRRTDGTTAETCPVAPGTRVGGRGDHSGGRGGRRPARHALLDRRGFVRTPAPCAQGVLARASAHAPAACRHHLEVSRDDRLSRPCHGPARRPARRPHQPGRREGGDWSVPAWLGTLHGGDEDYRVAPGARCPDATT